jgi:ABC-type Fe3+/spermidine/putrescine transport system ATPase subunit
MAVLKVEGLRKRFGNVQAVDDVSFEVKDGEVLSLLGPSGCGKTTTLRCLAGFEMPDRGKIYLDNREISFLTPEQRGIGMVFQNYALWPHMTVYNNLAFGLQIRKLEKKEIEERIKRVLGIVRLSGYEDHYPRQLSGGQQQRIAMARALVIEPDIMLLDEPLSNLDAQLREEMRFEFIELQRKLGITAIYVTHDQAEAMVISDKIIILNQGRVIQTGTPREIYTTPQSRFVAGFIAVTSFINGTVSSLGQDNQVMVKTDDNLLINGFRPGLKVGDQVSVAIRINTIRFVTDSEKVEKKDRKNVFKGKILQASYLGDIVDYRIKLGEWVVRTDSSSKMNYRVGDEVDIYLPPEELIIIPEGK